MTGTAERWWPTHVISAEEIWSACVRTAPDIEPFLPPTVEPGEHMYLPARAFDGLRPGDLVALRITGATVSMVPVDRECLAAPPPGLRSIMRRFARDNAGSPGGLAALVAHAAEHLPRGAGRRTMPLGELLARYGIVAAGDRIALAGFDFAAYDRDEQVNALAVVHGIGRDLASAVHALRSSFVGGSPDPVDIARLARIVDTEDALGVLIEPWVHDIEPGSPRALERRAIVDACTALAPVLDGAAARVLRWISVALAAVDAPLAEMVGHVERLRLVSDGWAPGARWIADWDADRVPAAPAVVDSVLAKALAFLGADGPARLALMGVIDGITAGTLDGAMASRLVEDRRARMIALCEGGAMARFVERRGAVLPHDEAIVAAAMGVPSEHRMYWAGSRPGERGTSVMLRDDAGSVVECRLAVGAPLPAAGAPVLAWVVAGAGERWAVSVIAVPPALGGEAVALDAVGVLGALVRSA
ncbi:hypothetical protein HT102_15260 [Hoyosella sp. G463]|uniref:Uncharacterized protein n=1 Tax=Lolliginicoccus lacisalsi TaxID=2742202 RepID=A0A927PNA3_9ACTN|nr:hypothetical protein [Lolliginicoccus lacisalsi]MBD8507847.1 hypothetical protein [Lolliginicoccus lacisalsi]